ncbi:MAG: flagellar basal-body rod protein FlgF [Deltaproteobacteria bacterium]|nr:flagellar basal-body rod protein FlgF [Deltaproteobacteria bacterium]
MSLTQAMYAASAGAYKNQQRLDVLANNLANINTPGFKQDKLVFRVPVGAEKEGNSQTDYLQGPSAAMARGGWTDFSQGILRCTDNPLDLALDGTGFFCVRTPEGTRYTRNGSFTINGDGVLATRDGHPVLGKGGEIKIDGRNVSVDEEGKVSVDGSEVGTLKVVSVLQPESLKKMGNTLFASAGADEKEAEGFKIREGYIETSNVNAIRAMTEMIDISRSYESYQKTIQFLNDATKKSINEVGRLA